MSLSTSTAPVRRPTLAILASLLALGLGYVYVGEIRRAIVTAVGMYTAFAIFGWTRIIVCSAAFFWFLVGIVAIGLALSLIHPLAIAIRNRHRPLRPYNRWWFYLLWTAVVSIPGLVIATNRASLFGYEPFRIPSVSMSPTLQPGDFFMVDTWRYKYHMPSVGEVIVYEAPDEGHVKFVKRIVAGPGDTVESRNAVLYRNGQPVAETYVHSLQAGEGFGRDFPPTLIGPGNVFVLGDYRDNSFDSRTTGPIPFNKIHGRAEYIWFSISNERIHWSRVSRSLLPEQAQTTGSASH